YALDRRWIHFKSPDLAGVSGAPVFDREMNLVAIHVARTEAVGMRPGGARWPSPGWPMGPVEIVLPGGTRLVGAMGAGAPWEVIVERLRSQGIILELPPGSDPNVVRAF